MIVLCGDAANCSEALVLCLAMVRHQIKKYLRFSFIHPEVADTEKKRARSPDYGCLAFAWVAALRKFAAPRGHHAGMVPEMVEAEALARITVRMVRIGWGAEKV